MSYREGKCRWGYRSIDLLKLTYQVSGVLLQLYDALLGGGYHIS